MDPLSPELKAAIADLDARINWERRDRGCMRVDLAPMRDIARRLDMPHLAYRTVHVGGTKGKGTVAALLAAVLSKAGVRAGCYASPHVERVTERVRIDGRDVDDDLLARGIRVALRAREEAEADGTPGAAATWFDLFTAAALWVFRAAGVAWAVVEVGLGGRLDSTNVIEPQLCVLTNIDLEHTALLGDTRAAIAGEKAGILKPEVPVILGVEAHAGDDPLAVIVSRAEVLGAPVTHAASASDLVARNLALARAAIQVLSTTQAEGALGGALAPELLEDESFLAAAGLAGRLERRHAGQVPVVLDGAHVPSSLEAVLEHLGSDPTLRGPCLAVISMGSDKDVRGMFKALQGRADRVFCSSVENGMHSPADELAALAAEQGLASESVLPARAALQRAVDAADDGWVLVTGSLYLVGALRCALEPAAPVEET